MGGRGSEYFFQSVTPFAGQINGVVNNQPPPMVDISREGIEKDSWINVRATGLRRRSMRLQRCVASGTDIHIRREPFNPTGGVDCCSYLNGDTNRTDVDPTPPPSSSYTKSQTLVCNGEVRTNSEPVVHPHLGGGRQDRGDDGGGMWKNGRRSGCGD